MSIYIHQGCMQSRYCTSRAKWNHRGRARARCVIIAIILSTPAAIRPAIGVMSVAKGSLAEACCICSALLHVQGEEIIVWGNLGVADKCRLMMESDFGDAQDNRRWWLNGLFHNFMVCNEVKLIHYQSSAALQCLHSFDAQIIFVS